MTRVRLSLSALLCIYAMDEQEVYYPTQAARLGLSRLERKNSSRLSRFGVNNSLRGFTRIAWNDPGISEAFCRVRIFNEIPKIVPSGSAWRTQAGTRALRFAHQSIAAFLLLKAEQRYSQAEVAAQIYEPNSSEALELADLVWSLEYSAYTPKSFFKPNNLHKTGAAWLAQVPAAALQHFFAFLSNETDPTYQLPDQVRTRLKQIGVKQPPQLPEPEASEASNSDERKAKARHSTKARGEESDNQNELEQENESGEASKRSVESEEIRPQQAPEEPGGDTFLPPPIPEPQSAEANDCDALDPLTCTGPQPSETSESGTLLPQSSPEPQPPEASESDALLPQSSPESQPPEASDCDALLPQSSPEPQPPEASESDALLPQSSPEAQPPEASESDALLPQSSPEPQPPEASESDALHPQSSPEPQPPEASESDTLLPQSSPEPQPPEASESDALLPQSSPESQPPETSDCNAFLLLALPEHQPSELPECNALLPFHNPEVQHEANDKVSNLPETRESIATQEQPIPNKKTLITLVGLLLEQRETNGTSSSRRLTIRNSRFRPVRNLYKSDRALKAFNLCRALVWRPQAAYFYLALGLLALLYFQFQMFLSIFIP